VCGRYTLATPDPAAVRARFGIGDTVEIRRRFNVAPGDEVLAVTVDREGRRRGELLRWGLVPSWARSAETGLKMINARVETAPERPAFKRSFERFRCLIPADGFYEWRRNRIGRREAFHISRDDGELVAFAGLWAIWHRPDGGTVRSCTILTQSANEAVAPLHDRMPIVLAAESEDHWLDPLLPASGVASLLRGLPAERTVLRPVGPAVNDARYDGPECLADPLEQQPSLF
jgi:putative SOS response-associated peptidase YedK